MIRKLDECKEILEGVVTRRAYTMQEMQEARRKLLDVIRYGIDDRAFGHMPDKRHY